MKILTIGNSFTEDPMRYLHALSVKEGEPIETTNLIIGGCSLERHANNFENEISDEMLEINGVLTGFNVTVREALVAKPWDVVTLQQCSPCSFDYSTFQPWLGKLVTAIRTLAPTAKLYLHETWAYAWHFPLLKEKGFSKPEEMSEGIRQAFDKAMAESGAEGRIPSRVTFDLLRQRTETRFDRDGFHASFGLGRYALACTWYMTLTGKDVVDGVIPLEEEISESDRQIALACAREAVFGK